MTETMQLFFLNLFYEMLNIDLKHITYITWLLTFSMNKTILFP